MTAKNEPHGPLEIAITALGHACGFLTLARNDPVHLLDAAQEFGRLATAAAACQLAAENKHVTLTGQPA